MADKTLWSKVVEARKVRINPKFDKKNPHFNSKFASLPATEEAANEMFSAQGLQIMTTPVWREGKQYLVGTITDGVEVVEVASIEMPVLTDPQKMGSLITYYRRYLICAIAGIVGEEDDDGNAAAQKDKASGKARELLNKYHAIGIPADDLKFVLKQAGGVTDATKLTADKEAAVIAELTQKFGAI